MNAFDAIVLSGGSARRLGGVNKTALVVGDRPVLARVTEAVASAERVVVVGDDSGVTRVDVSTREEPPGGGPVAGVAAGLVHVRADTVVVLAGDQPFVTGQVIRQLLDAVGSHAVGSHAVGSHAVGSHAVGSHAAAVAADADGRLHWLLAAWRTASLRAALEAIDVNGAAARSLYDGADVVGVRFDGEPPPWADVDTPADLRSVRERVEERRP